MPDAFESASPSNSTYQNAANLNGSIDSNLQVNLPNLDITTSNPNEWFYVNVPAGTTGTMQVTMQSSGLSSLSPRLMVYNSNLTIRGQASSSSYGGTVTVTIPNVTTGQGFYIRTISNGGSGNTGNYGMGVDFGSVPLATFPPPNTTVAQQPSQGGGSESMSVAQIRSNPAWLSSIATQLTVDSTWARSFPTNPWIQGFAFAGFNGPLGSALSWFDPGALVASMTTPSQPQQTPASPPTPVLNLVSLIDSVLANWNV